MNENRSNILLICDIVAALVASLIVLWIFVIIIEYSNVVLPESLLLGLAGFIGLATGSWYLFKRYPTNVIPLITNGNCVKAICYGLSSGLLLALFIFPYSHVFQNGKIVDKSLINNDNMFFIVLFLLFAIILGPLIEEVFFRGCLFRVLRSRINFFVAISFSTLVFVSCHVIASDDQFLKMVIVSLLLTFVYEYSGNIFSSIIAHIVGNGIWYAAVYLHRFGVI